MSDRRDSTDALQGEWVVTALYWPDHSAVMTVDGRLTVYFEDDRVIGNAGCNTFRGTVSCSNHALSFGPLMTTRMAADEATMQQEQVLLVALANTVSFRLDQQRLTLERPDGLISLVLHRNDD